MPRIEEPRRGDPIRFEWALALVRALNDLIENGPEVSPPLFKKGGVVYLGQEYEIHDAIAVGTISARTAATAVPTTGSSPGASTGSQWGQGPGVLIAIDADGNELLLGSPLSTVLWNPFGAPISAGVRVLVSWSHGRWTIRGGDCSGVA